MYEYSLKFILPLFVYVFKFEYMYSYTDVI